MTKRRVFNLTIRMVPALVLPALVLLTGCDIDINASDDNGDRRHSVSEPFEHEIVVEHQDRFSLHGINGEIHIVGKTDGTAVEIWGKKTVRSDSRRDAEAHLDDLKIRVSSSEREVTVRTDQPKDSGGRNYEVVYNVRIPQSWRVEAENINGEVEVSAIRNDVSIDLTNGNARVTGVLGNVDVVVVNGVIAGNIALPTQGICRMTSINGKIDLVIPRSTSAEFSADITHGDIHTSNLALKDLNRTKRSTRGTLAGGRGTIMLKVINGQIDVKGF